VPDLLTDLGSGPVGLDTPVFIYFMQEHPRYLHIVEHLVQAIDDGLILGVTSTVTLLETLVHPLRQQDYQLAAEYEAVLTQSRNLELIELSIPLLRSAANIRASTGIKTPDALQIAAARSMACTAFVTNDRRLPEMENPRILQLDWFVESE
jgi:predicted nucleic acid-binding protein